MGTKNSKRLLAAGLSLALVLISPGLEAWAAIGKAVVPPVGHSGIARLPHVDLNIGGSTLQGPQIPLATEDSVSGNLSNIRPSPTLVGTPLEVPESIITAPTQVTAKTLQTASDTPAVLEQQTGSVTGKARFKTPASRMQSLLSRTIQAVFPLKKQVGHLPETAPVAARQETAPAPKAPSDEDLADTARDPQKKPSDRLAAIRLLESRGEKARAAFTRLAQDASLAADLGDISRSVRQRISDRVASLRVLRSFIRTMGETPTPATREATAAVSKLGGDVRDGQQPLADRIASVRILDAFGSPEARAELEKSANDVNLVAELQDIAKDLGRPREDRMAAMAGLDALGTTEARSALEIIAYDHRLGDMGLRGVRSISGHLVSIREKEEMGVRQASPIIPPLTYESDLSAKQKKVAVMGLFFTRFFSLLGATMSTLAYTPMVIKAVGDVSMYTLGALGGIVNIVLALLVGKIMDGLQNKKSAILFNFSLRTVISFITAAFIGLGMVSMPSLLVLTALSTLQFVLLFVLDFAMMADLSGNEHEIRANEAMIRIATIIVTVGAGIFLGKHLVDAIGYMWTFVIAGAVQIIPVLILKKTIPAGIGRKAGIVPVDYSRVNAEFLRYVFASIPPLHIPAPIARLGKGLISAWNSLLFAAVQLYKAVLQVYVKLKALPARTWLHWAGYGLLFALVSYLFFFSIPPLAYPVFHSLTSFSLHYTLPITFLQHSPVPFVLAAGWLLMRSPSYTKVIATHPMLKLSLAFIMICAFVEIPMRNSVLGVLATETAGKGAGASELFGKLIAAFYMGQMPTGTGMADPNMTFTFSKIGPFKLSTPLQVNFKRVMKWVGALGLAAWANFMLLPKGWLLSLATKLSLGAMMPAWAFSALGLAFVSGAAVTIYIAIHNVTPKIKQRTWMGAEAWALAIVGIVPLVFGLAPWALYLSLAIFGMIHNPTTHTVSANFTATLKRFMPSMVQYFSAFRGAFVNIAMSIAMATYGTAKLVPQIWGDSHAFPFTWYMIAVIYFAFAVLFMIGKRVLPFEEKR